MIVLSLIFVIVAAVLLVAGFFQSPGLELIWSSIAACVLAMIFLGIGVLQRRRSQEPASAPGGYGSGPGRSGSAPAPARPSTSRPADAAEEGDLGDEDEDVVVRKVTAEERAEQAAAAPARKKVVGRETPEPEPAAAETSSFAATGTEPAASGTTGEAAREVLAGVKGLGPAKQQALLDHFGSLEAIEAASAEQLLEVKGFGPALADQVAAQLRGGDQPGTEPPAGETTGEAAREVLAGVKGLGPAKQQALLDEFGSLEAIRGASEEELLEVKGFGPSLARQVKDQL